MLQWPLYYIVGEVKHGPRRGNFDMQETHSDSDSVLTEGRLVNEKTVGNTTVEVFTSGARLTLPATIGSRTITMTRQELDNMTDALDEMRDR